MHHLVMHGGCGELHLISLANHLVVHLRLLWPASTLDYNVGVTVPPRRCVCGQIKLGYQPHPPPRSKCLENDRGGGGGTCKSRKQRKKLCFELVKLQIDTYSTITLTSNSLTSAIV